MKGAQPPFILAGLVGLRWPGGQHGKRQGEACGHANPDAMRKTMRHYGPPPGMHPAHSVMFAAVMWPELAAWHGMI